MAFDEQIFAIQAYGGISRMFAELANAFVTDFQEALDLLPINAPVVNRYLLDNARLRAHLQVTASPHSYRALAHYFSHTRPNMHANVVHNTFYLPHGLAGNPGAKRVVTIHDMIPEMMPQTRRRLDFLTLKRRYVDRADHIICVSEATRSDLIRCYGLPNAPVTVVHHGVDPRFQPGVHAIASLPARYVLFVGNRSQYKDAKVLMQAFANIADQYADLTLLFVGGGPFTRSEATLLDQLKLGARTIQQDLSDPDMPNAYANAELFVFPSRFEGFGLPALEAMASGAPTILARSTSLPEVGGDAALYFEPGDVDDLTQQMLRGLSDELLRLQLRNSGRTRAGEFTWRSAAQQLLDVYESSLS